MKTAVQLLKENLDEEIKLGTKMVVNWDMYLEIEKQHIITAFKQGLRSPYHQDSVLMAQEGQPQTKSEQYYSEIAQRSDAFKAQMSMMKNFLKQEDENENGSTIPH